jgi:RsiW-degrading membrane proteinase PrsW (M82 family)
MSSWSVSAQPRGGWKLRVLSGTSIGQEFDLPQMRYSLGSQAPAGIVIPDPSIAPQHIRIDLHSDHVYVTDTSGRGVQINGKPTRASRVTPGDEVTVGNFRFQFTNPNVTVSSPPTPTGKLVDKFLQWPLFVRVGAVIGPIAATLYILLVTTHAPTLAPVTLLAMSAVVPAMVLAYIIPKYDRKGISFQTLTITFLAGGSVGVISAMFLYLLGGKMFTVAFMAGLAEEPAKLLCTAWLWRNRRYDHPMDGLILGTVSGLGFAVFETAGYGFAALLTPEKGLQYLLEVMVIRGITSPFGHGLWSGILAAGFWQCNRDLKRAFTSKVFGMAALWAIGLHALWNFSEMFDNAGWLCLLASASLSVHEYRRLLLKNGYRPG